MPVEQLNAQLRDRGIIGGYDLAHDYPELGDASLFAVTDCHTRSDIDSLVSALEDIVGSVA
jgi:glycine dehydrogenase subunit 1